MSRENGNNSRLALNIPKIKAESETQTTGHLISRSPEKPKNFEMEEQNMSIRKRRNLSKNRGQATRYREKTPEPGRTPVPHEDTTTSDDEDLPQRSSREIEADNTYEEMRRLVQEKVMEKDPVYDIDTDEVLEARAIAANERRRRSISPFAVPDKEDMNKLERRGSFVDPTNKLLSALYNVSPKDEDRSRRSSLTIDPTQQRRSSLSPPGSSSPLDKEFPYPIPTTPKKLEKMVYPDEQSQEQKSMKPKSPMAKENIFNFDEKTTNKEEKQILKTPKTPEMTLAPGELVTKVIQIERSPSRRIVSETKTPETPPVSSEQHIKSVQVERTSSLKVSQEAKPHIEVRERIVRTPSRKLSDVKPIIVRRQPEKPIEAPKLPPVKPARSKSATRFGGKTSESDVSEDQIHQSNVTASSRRKVIPTPRRFQRNRSPRANRSQSVNRVEDIKVIDRTGTVMSETSKEIIELMQKARARSLSIPKDDPRAPPQYKSYSKTLQTPNKTPSETPRRTRGISCPKTIQIISDTEILTGLVKKQIARIENDKSSRQSSGYIDASQSEYTSSCYSTSPSENDLDFDLADRAAELTHKLHLLNEEINKRETRTGLILADENVEKKQHKEKSGLRKRTVSATKNEESKQSEQETKEKTENRTNKTKTQSKFKFLANWQQFKIDNKVHYEKIVLLRNRCFCDLLLLIFMFGLGGMMFKSLEGSFENVYKCSTKNVKRDFIEALWRGSNYLREEDWKSLARKKLFEFEEQLHTAHEAGVTSYSGRRSWNFMNSFVYCMSLVTTIGYGYIAPKTTYGRVATIVYAIIGIPLFLIVLADFGKLFTRIIKFFWSFIRRFYYTRSCRKVRRTVHVQDVMKGLNIAYNVVRRPSQMFSEEDMGINQPNQEPPPILRRPSDIPPPLPPKPSAREGENETEPPETPAPSVFEIDDEFNLPISVAIFVLVVYIIIGALAYSLWETWNFFESFYFVFISMSTIGLGDIVPDHPVFMMSSILYLVFGLALTSMCINVVQIKLSDTFRMASAKLGATIGLKVAEEDGSLATTPGLQPIEDVPVHKPRKEEKEEAKDL